MNTNETQSPGSLHPVVRQKLWRVRLRGSGMERYNPSHVIAPDATAAYQAVRRELDRLDYGFSKDRELLSVELVAEDYEYTELGSRLFLPNDQAQRPERAGCGVEMQTRTESARSGSVQRPC